jgi:hypothetical protein
METFDTDDIDLRSLELIKGEKNLTRGTSTRDDCTVFLKGV